MYQLTHILHLEDDATDAELIQATLESAGIVCQINRVQNRDEFTQALQQGEYDLILADYRLPAYDGVSALRLAQELRPDLSFIFVSGTLGEDAVIIGLTQGATDYVLKQKLSRLAPAVERALREAENQRMRQRAEEALQAHVQHSQSLLRLSKQLERAQTYGEILNAALAEVRTIIGYQNLWVYLLTEDRQHVEALTAGGYMSESVMTGEGIATLTIRGDRMLEEIIAATHIVLVEDAPLDERTDKVIVARLGNRTIVNVPIILFDKHLGTVGTGTFGAEGVRVPTPSEQEYLMAMASHMAASLDRLRLFEQRQQAETALRESEERFSKAFRLSPMAISIVRAVDGRFVDVNDVFVKTAGYTREEIVGRTSNELQLWANPEQQASRMRQLQEQGSAEAFEFNLRTQSGEIRIGLAATAPIELGGEKHNLTLIYDITERKRAEARILRLNQLYATLSQINQTIVHVRDREKLFREICRVAVEHGQFRLAWIGLIDEVTYRVEPVAYAGEEQGYLTAITITSQDEPWGRDPTGTAIREGRCMLCQDIATDARMIPWRDQSLQRGYRSSAAVPFRQHRRVVGALTVYTAEPQGFDAEDEQLLDEIGQDISYALDVLEQEAQRRQVEAELSQLNAELEQRVIDRTAELARAHEHLRAILDTAGEGVVFTDLQGTIEYINPAMERLTGYTAEEALGRNPRLWKSDQTPSTTHLRMWGALTRGEIWEGELINRRKDGSLYDAALTVAPLSNPKGQTVGFVGIQRDITRQKELERMKDQFVSNVSHELRTPLANILLHIGLVEHGKPDRLGSYQQTLRREAERLRKMIEDLLDLSRLDRNVAPIQLAPIDLNQLLDHLVTDRAALAEQRGLTLTYEPAPDLPLVLADAPKLIQVASNLLTNALNYTPAGGVVSVWAEVRSQTGQSLAAFTVRDTGPGISAQDMPHLFERFYRGAAGRQASAPGTGLGLAISQEIMKRLGGRITFESEVGRGAAFTVWLPMA